MLSLSHPLSRRAFLRGVGVSMALPWLESVPVWGDEKTRIPAGSSEPPVRLACLFAGNGFHSKEWYARGEGTAMELGKVLEPLAPFREKMLFIRGLYNEEALIAKTVEEAADIMLKGGIPNPHLDEKLKAWPVTPEQRSQLLAFLRSLAPASNPYARPVIP